MNKPKIELNCDICNMPYQQGPHIYEGHRLDIYGGIFCCDRCWYGNADGWISSIEPILLKHLKSKGLQKPARNSNGFLPRC